MNSLAVTCPSCGETAYIVSIFGSVCGRCFYDPAKATLPPQPQPRTETKAPDVPNPNQKENTQ